MIDIKNFFDNTKLQNMKKIYNIKWVLLFLMTCVATLAQAVEITFNVSVPNGTQKVYIIGSTDALGNWNANGGGAKLMTQVDATNWTIAIDLVANTTYQYMFLCGPNWAYEQSPNTNFPFTTGTSDAIRNNTITAWNSVPPKVATVTFNVSVPSTTEKVYIAGGDNDDATTLDELGNWNVPTGRCLQMDKTGVGTFSLTMDLSPDKIYYYKYLCGASWDYEQQAANAFEVNTSSPQTTNDVIEAWKGVPAELSTVQNYLKRNGNQITDAAGNNFVMRSIGLGNYMVWEPYMWKVSNYTNAGIMQDIVGRMSQLLTPEDMQSFINGYMSNYITKDEVDS